jgi:hypothetical protein
MIDCLHLTKRFGNFTAVDDVSSQVPGGICALPAPNGAGKSPLLKDFDRPAAEISRPLEELYFELIGPTGMEDDLSWLPSSPY